ncbi:putative NAD(P)H nitroreductase YodC [Xylanibacillus composti]|uniref:Putative NAD(P)H nitroreductase YodC n=2 Tax=Xylanibacillus composti TaxID=1572762 RepID=A0A8J4H271_9BACL|nr:putative NAD(P)H nitroreductase YodC [Xylanibacillus composti]
MQDTKHQIIAEIMRERSSVRKYKKGLRIPKETLEEIIALAGTAPSGWNLQHWKFIVVQEEERKQRLLPIAYNQEQIVDCSAVVAVLGDWEADKNAEKVCDAAVQAGYMTPQARDILVKQIHTTYATDATIDAKDGTINPSLAAMQLMLAAAALGISSCPIGGFKHDELRRELQFPDRYKPIMLITLGYAEKPAHQTIRFPVEDILDYETFGGSTSNQ